MTPSTRLRAAAAVSALLAGLLILAPARPLQAGGPLVVDLEGAPVGWDAASPLAYYTDRGGLGMLGHAAAVDLVESLFAVWEEVPTATLDFVRGGDLGVDVDETNFGPFLGSFGGATEPLGRTAVVFDRDGAIFDEMFGVGTGVLGFAGPTFVFDGEQARPIQGGRAPVGSRIIEGIAFLNGKYIDGIRGPGNQEIDLEDFRGVFVHEFGHLSGLDHTQIHGLRHPADSDLFGVTQPVETMFPSIFAGAGQASLERDDEVAFSLLYPSPDFAATTGCIAGRIASPDGSPLSGANVIAWNLRDPADAVSFVSGSNFVDRGEYRLCGLQPGERYRVELQAIEAAHVGGSGVGPFSPAVTVPGPPEHYNGAAESDDPALDEPGEIVAIQARAGVVDDGVDIVVNRQTFDVRNLPYAGSMGPWHFGVGDFDEDGNLDFVGSNQGFFGVGNRTSVVRGFGTGNFYAPATVDRFPGNAHLAVGQFNAEVDQHLDLAVASGSLNEVRLYLGDGRGRFSAPILLLASPDSERFSATLVKLDLDADPFDDLAFLLYEPDGSTTVYGLLGSGNGSFAPVTTRIPAEVGARPFSATGIVAGAFTPGPGDDVLFVTNQGLFDRQPRLALLEGDGRGGFVPSIIRLSAVAEVIGRPLATADLDGDGDLDLALPILRPAGGPSNHTRSFVGLLLGDGRGRFELSSRYAVPEPWHDVIVLAHLDGDGALDVASTGAAGRGRPGAHVSVAFGDGRGGIRGQSIVWGLPEIPGRAMAGGDFDGDGRTDLLVSDSAVKGFGLSPGPSWVPGYSVLTHAEGICARSRNAHCLQDGRFQVEVAWRDFEGRTGLGRAVPLTGDSGYFWFFHDANVELVVKVLDGRPVNGHFWVFFGALSTVEYTITVTDSATGEQRSYRNPSGQLQSRGDTRAFRAQTAEGASAAAAGSRSAAGQPAVLPAPVPAAQAACAGEPLALCLRSGRFRAEVAWRDATGRTGTGHAVPLSRDSGYFWFFDDGNVELVAKVLDGRVVNGHFWVFHVALSNVEYTLTVTDTETGLEKSYFSPLGEFGREADTAAF